MYKRYDNEKDSKNTINSPLGTYASDTPCD